jgi:hypothetical protein
MSGGVWLSVGLLLGYSLERLRWKRIRRKHGAVNVKINDPAYNGMDVDAFIRAIERGRPKDAAERTAGR